MKVAQATDKGIRLTIHTDDNPCNPRTEFDHLGKMVCWHRRYNLGDKHDFSTPDNFQEWFKEQGLSVMLPLYLYDHSGITMRTSSFNDRWDSGQVGWAYATSEQILKEYSAKKITPELIAKVEKILVAEIKEYDTYLRGEIYGYVLEKVHDCGECGKEVDEHIDSCWGFYGSNWKENGMVDNVGKEYVYLFDKLEDC